MTNNPVIEIIGAGVTGLCCARIFVDRGCHVILRAHSNGTDSTCCSWWAGGMLAPWCESENTEPLIMRLGLEGLAFWQLNHASLVANGSLVVAHQRDQSDLQQFAKRTSQYRAINPAEIADLEPDLAGQFTQALYYEKECHIDPREALKSLLNSLTNSEHFEFFPNEELSCDYLRQPPEANWRIDCRGLSARDSLPDLRGVKGEMVILDTADISFSRPIRVLHPRHPIYIVPRANQQFMVGATMLESDDRHKASVRSVMELLNSAYALHPAFAEATLIEVGTDARPAFMDNLPRVRRRGRTVYVNGLYRHGFLCAPALAQRCAALTLDGQIDVEVVDENTH